MSKEREMIEKLCSFQMTYSDWLLLIADAEELLAQPEQEPVAWIMHNKETGYRVQAAYRPSALKKGWEAIPLYAGSPKREQEQHGTQYLLDQVSMLRAENAMLKEKWSTPKREPLSHEHLEALVDKYHGYPRTLVRTVESIHGIKTKGIF